MNPEEFKRIRNKMGLTQSQLAELLGLSGRNPVTHYEMGERNPSTLIVALMLLFDELSEKKALELQVALRERILKAERKKR